MLNFTASRDNVLFHILCQYDQYFSSAKIRNCIAVCGSQRIKSTSMTADLKNTFHVGAVQNAQAGIVEYSEEWSN